MNDRFKLLKGDDDVLSFDSHRKMLKIGKLREQVRENFLGIAKDLLSYGHLPLSIDKYSGEMGIGGMINNMTWNISPKEGIDCELLMLGAQSWYKGKLRIKVFLEFLPALEQFNSIQTKKIDSELLNRRMNKSDILGIDIMLEFCPDEPEVTETPATNQMEINSPESPLDDIRRMINQESQQ